MKYDLVRKGLSDICRNLAALVGLLLERACGNKLLEERNMNMALYNGIPDKTVKFSQEVLDAFRQDVGCCKAETGGMLASTTNEQVIDKCHFDTHSQNTPGTFYYDVESMSAVFREWKAAGCTTNGIYHSHPKGATLPSYHDISTALLHINFFGLDYFYLPIFQPERHGFYTMYFYVVKKVGDNLEVSLSYVLGATENGYHYLPFRAYKRVYSIAQLNAYRASIDKPAAKSAPKKEPASPKPKVPTQEYFKKVAALYPDKVLDKVIVCVGTGGARSFLEDCARSGFRNYILMDADIVSPSNVATQGVFISEMGKKKVDVIRDRIMDINPAAHVLCVDKFLDDNMSDEEFFGYMAQFPGKKPTDYLILGCTDNFEAQKRSSLLALKCGAPYLAAMMYECGAAAELIFVYPGVTESCPRCLLRSRFEKYENGFVNDVSSAACPIFATERMNALKGYLALMLLMYGEDPQNPFSTMLDDVKNRNFVQIRLLPDLKDRLGIGMFDRVLSGASRYTYFDETLWVPQHPDRPEFGAEPCKLCGGTGDLAALKDQWKTVDTRTICFTAA